ncbi:MAG: pilus assembly protein [Deltaproteobacteria bacterium]|jgi:Flp pilus assembly protein TadG|nr:pilus assembly protein [Deltaproteobacteria bacterium]
MKNPPLKRKTVITRDNGSVLVEFVIVFPLLMILIFGTIEFGILLYNKAVLTNASREGAREGVVYVHKSGADDTFDTADDSYHPSLQNIRDKVKAYAQTHLITFGNDILEDNDIIVNPTDPENGISGKSLTVTVYYRYDFLLLPSFIENFRGGLDLVQTTIMRFE